MRRLEGRSEPRPPVAGPATTVGHGHDLDVLTAKDVHQAEGISRKNVSACAAAIAWPSSGARLDRGNGPPQFLSEPVRGLGTSRGIPVIRGFRLLRCSRMEPNRR